MRKYSKTAFCLRMWDSSFQFCGCCILGFGIYLLVHNNLGVLFHKLPFLTLGNVLIIVGTIIMVVAFLGCMGSIKENKCLLMSVSTYSGCGTLSEMWYPNASSINTGKLWVSTSDQPGLSRTIIFHFWLGSQGVGEGIVTILLGIHFTLLIMTLVFIISLHIILIYLHIWLKSSVIHLPKFLCWNILQDLAYNH